MDALEDIPEVKFIKTKRGDARLEKTDIFRKLMWFSYKDENTWHPIPAKRVKEIIALNKKGETPESLTLDEVVLELKDTKINSDLEKMDARFRKKDDRQKKTSQQRRKKKGGPRRPQQDNKQNQQQPKNQQGSPKPSNSRKKPFRRNKKTNDS